MSSQQDQAFANYLISIGSQIYAIFSYSVPWLGLAISTFALVVLMLRKRRDGKLLIYIFKWQYAIAIIYWLNMVFNDNQYSERLFHYNLRVNVFDPICKLSFMFLRFIYCVSPWMQVVIYLKVLILTKI